MPAKRKAGRKVVAKQAAGDDGDARDERGLCQPVHDPATTLYEWFVNARTLLVERETGERAGGCVAVWAKCRRENPTLLALDDKHSARAAALAWILADRERETGCPPPPLAASDVGGGDGPSAAERRAAAAARGGAPCEQPCGGPPASAAGGDGDDDDDGDDAAGAAAAAAAACHEEPDADGDLWGWRRGRLDTTALREGERIGDLFLSNVTLRYDGVELLEGAQLRLLAGHRYGFVGQNGSGKSTLLRTLARRALPGLPRHIRVWCVQQEYTASSGQSCLEAVVAADAERLALLAETERLEGDDSGDAAADAERLAAIQERLDDISAHDAEDRARRVLQGLRFTAAMMDASTSSLSGGWRQRIALAQALFVRDRLDLLLLDEPSNHLDLPALLWLEKLLCEESDGLTVVIVSHDTVLLDSVVTDMMHLDHRTKTLEYFPGDYSAWREVCEERDRRNQQKVAAADKQEKKAKAFLDKQRSMQNSKRRDDNKQRQAAERQKKMERVARMGIGGAHQRGQKVQLTSTARLFREDGKRFKLFSLGKMSPEALLAPQRVEALRNDPALRFRFPQGVQFASPDVPLLCYDNAQLGYESRPNVLSRVSLAIHPTSRIAIVGANGSGKTTLLRHLAGSDDVLLSDGEISRHPGLRIAYVAQHHIDALSAHGAISPAQYLVTVHGEAAGVGSEHAARAHLGCFGLGGPVALRPISVLSGGQKARVAFAAASLPLSAPPHILLLDEPTNHLDADATEALTAGLCDFVGAVVVVSHNRGFIQACCSDLWVVHKGHVTATHHTEGDGGDALSAAFEKYCASL